MANKTTNIPRDIKRFNLYLNQTCAYIMLGTPITNGVRLGWSLADITFWVGLQTRWNPLFLLYSNKKGSYTTDVKNDLMNIIAEAVAYNKTNKLIPKVKATVGLTSLDCSTFNVPQSLSTTPTGAHAAKSKEIDKTIIPSELVYPKIIPIGGGVLQIKVYTESVQSGRAHNLKSFDEVEYAIAVFYSTATGLPTDPSDARLTKDYSSKANFKLPTAALTNNLTVIPAGSATPVKMAVLFFRWAKSKHPNLDGPWSGPFFTTLL